MEKNKAEQFRNYLFYETNGKKFTFDNVTEKINELEIDFNLATEIFDSCLEYGSIIVNNGYFYSIFNKTIDDIKNHLLNDGSFWTNEDFKYFIFDYNLDELNLNSALLELIVNGQLDFENIDGKIIYFVAENTKDDTKPIIRLKDEENN